MKSLTESLFDRDLITKDLPYESLYKHLQKRLDPKQIRRWIVGLGKPHMVSNINDKDLRWWCEELIKKDIRPAVLGIESFSNLSDDDDAREWLKFGTIHDYVCWNDRMYANSADIPWIFWESSGDSTGDNITEWIMWNNKEGDVMVITNRKHYPPEDQKALHLLIENISKYNKKGTL